MTSIGPGFFNVSSFQKSGIEASAKKMTDEEIARFKKIQELLYSKPANLDELKNHVSQQVYAEVKVNGKTVATLYNGGSSMTSNAMHSKIRNLPSMGEGETSTGPELAQKRAEEIAKALGGTIVKADSAVTQAQYLSTPAFKVEYAVDYEAMERDRRAAEGRVTTPQTQVDTQSLAQSEAVGKSAADEFLAFTSKSWEEKVRIMILKSMGLDEESLDALSGEERLKIEAKIKEKIEEEVEKKTGMSVGGAVAAA